MNHYLAAAGGISFVTFLVHTIAGGREVVGPLTSAPGLPRIPMLVAYYCWHMVTILLAAMAAGFAYAALRPDGFVLAVALTLLSGAFALLSVGMAVATRSRLRDLPQWTLFVAIAVPAALGLL